jgi:Tol biopolymer transport system component
VIVPSGDLDLAVVSLRGAQRRLTVPRGTEIDPNWSLDEQWIVFIAEPSNGGSAELRLVPETPVFPGSSSGWWRPAVPRGRRMGS